MAYNDPSVAVTSAARTTTGNSGAQASEKGLQMNLLVEVTAASGTSPTLLFSVEWSMDGTNFGQVDTTADAFASITTGPTRTIKQFPIRAPFYRLVWTIGGTTPSFTFQATKYTTA